MVMVWATTDERERSAVVSSAAKFLAFILLPTPLQSQRLYRFPVRRVTGNPACKVTKGICRTWAQRSAFGRSFAGRFCSEEKRDSSVCSVNILRERRSQVPRGRLRRDPSLQLRIRSAPCERKSGDSYRIRLLQIDRWQRLENSVIQFETKSAQLCLHRQRRRAGHGKIFFHHRAGDDQVGLFACCFAIGANGGAFDFRQQAKQQFPNLHRIPQSL